MAHMEQAMEPRVKLLPLLILVAAASFALRAVDIYAGLSVLTQPVEAQDDQESRQEGDAAGDEPLEVADPAQQEPIVIGLPSNEELELITQLRERREMLDRREQSLDLQTQLLASTEKRINDKIVQLEVLEARIKDHLRLFEEREAAQLQSIVQVYEKMKAKEAAPRFEALNLQVQLDLVTRMKPSKVADLMSQMTPAAASRLTTELATLAQPPSLEEVQGGGR